MRSRADRAPQSRDLPACRSVLMVGTDLNGMGGVRAVVQGYLESGLFEKIDCAYVATHRYGSHLAKLSAALTGWLRVAARLHTLDAPLVHVHMSPGASFWRKSVVCALARLHHRPYVLHVHAGPFERFYESSSPLARRIVRAVLARAERVIALTRSWREILARIEPRARIEVMPNGVSLPVLDETRSPDERRPTLLFLGDVGQHKGAFDLVRAFARIAHRFAGLRLVYGGVGDIDRVRVIAAELGVADRIECPGWLAPEAKRAALAGAAGFVLPSYMEGMPMALLEAMSFGLPVIATAVGGVPEIITPEVDGLLVPPGDIAALAAAMARLVGDPQLRRRLGVAARATVANRFSLEAAVERLLALYRGFGIESRAACARKAISLEVSAAGK
jgi:glycosyltransferase involved in cell wall biosynthesis